MTITPDQGKSYSSAIDAIEDFGMFYEGIFLGPRNAFGKAKTYKIFSHQGMGYYYFGGMDHYNTSIHSITMKRLKNNIDSYERIG